MKVYIDLIFFINFIYDFLLLLTVSIVLKRKVKLIRHFLSALLGGLSLVLLFIPLNKGLLLILKILVSIIMCLISFKYISFRYTLNNLIYLYMCSIILAGFLYLLNNELAYAKVGMLFVFQGYSVNYLLLLIIAPIILYFYIKSNKKLAKEYNLYYRIDIVFDDIKLNCLALFDSGNNLKDPVTKKSVIIVSEKLLKKIYHIRSPMYISFKTISESGLMKCYKPSYIVINNHKIYNYLVGETKIKMADGIEALLNVKLMEECYV